jgi:Fe-S-cluster containining protein
MPGSGIARFELKTAAGTLEGEVDLPNAPVTVEQMLPILHGIGSGLIQLTVQQVEAEGRAISCRAGCGACCRQIVPITEHEARALAELVLTMPEPRRTRVLLRFRDAVARLEEAGVRQRIEQLHLIPTREQRTGVGLDYFRLGVACPFLEDESCSIHEVRPMACREYLVTSDPVHCQDPAAQKVEGVELPGKPLQALAAFGDGSGEPRFLLVPLVLALQFAAANPAPEATVPAPEMLQRFLASMSGGLPPAAESAPEQG